MNFKSDDDVLRVLIQAVQTAVGERPLTLDAVLGPDLRIESIDLVDIFFEMSDLTGADLDFSQFMLERKQESLRRGGVPVRDLIAYVRRRTGG